MQIPNNWNDKKDWMATTVQKWEDGGAKALLTCRVDQLFLPSRLGIRLPALCSESDRLAQLSIKNWVFYSQTVPHLEVLLAFIGNILTADGYVYR